MKYNFQNSIEEKVQVKITGTLDTKTWLRGIPDAAAACNELAIRASIETYLRSCFEHVQIQEHKEITTMLLSMGFNEDQVLKELRTGPFAVYFKFCSKEEPKLNEGTFPHK